ncbi:MAG: alpha/beta hydrolase family protein [Bacteroidales bacterium]
MNKNLVKFFVVCSLLFVVQANAKETHSIDVSAVKVDSLLWDLTKLSKAPAFAWLNAHKPVRSLAFDGLIYEGKPTRVFAYYSNPALLRGISSENKKYPGIILVHGGGGKAFKAWVEKWAADGYAALALDLSATGGDEYTFEGNGPKQNKEEKFEDIALGNLRNMWSYHAVADVILAHSLLLSFPVVNADKTVITGISWGGYLTCLAASLDNRFKAAAPVYGCGFYSDCVFQSDLAKMNPSDSLKWLKNFDPSSYLPYAKPRFLFINGNKDGWFFVNAYHKTYSLIKPEQRTVTIFPDMKHSHTDGWALEEIKYFFESVLNKGYPLIKVGKTAIWDSLISVQFDTNISVSAASFYYTNNLNAPNTKREWKEQQVTVDNRTKTVFCKMPEFKIGFFTLKDVRNLSVSSEYIFQERKVN